MRKYQQLALLIISCICIGIFFKYKSENNRLKDVLHVINFFGRSDAALLARVEDNNASMSYLLDFVHPLAVWQTIGDNFHSYSAFWRRNELVAGGEAVAVVVGRKAAILNFKCALNFRGSSSSVQGKFRFQRMDKTGEDDGSEFTRYQFFCRVTRDFGYPETVTFNDLTSATKTGNDGHILKLRYVRVQEKDLKKLAMQPLTICVDLYNRQFFNQTSADRQEQEMLQFFVHHFALGVGDFIVYNGDDLPIDLLPILQRLNIRVHLMPFNFPYSTNNSSLRIRGLIEADCLLRNTNRARHCLLLQANEFLYPSTKLDDDKSMLKSLKHYSNEVSRFVLPTMAVCKDEAHKYLIDNTLYDPEKKSGYNLMLYRLQDFGIASTTDESANAVSRTISLPLSMILSHQYVHCVHVGKDGLHDWRSSLRQDFMENIMRLAQEIKLLI